MIKFTWIIENIIFICQKYDHKFKDKKLLQNALTHKTYTFEAQIPLEYNERLEFLGDSVLNFVVAEQLYKSNNYFSEGELTRRRAILVNNNFLAVRAKELGIGMFLLFGKGEIKQNGNTNPKNLANALESLIGAVYLDSNLNKVKKMILSIVFNDSPKLWKSYWKNRYPLKNIIILFSHTIFVYWNEDGHNINETKNSR